MIGYACEVAATTAAARVPELIAEALAARERRRGWRRRRSAVARGGRRHERTGPDRRPGRHRGDRRPRRARGPGRRSRRAAAGRPGATGWAARRSASASATTGSSSASGSSPGPARRSGRSPPRSARPSPRPSSGCSASSSARSRSSSMASEADQQRGRRTGRRLALAAVFEAEFGQRTADAILERHLAETERDETAAALARELVAAVVRHRDAIDARITAVAPAIPGRRLARMDRALLRSAIGEVLHSARRRPGWPSPSGSSWHGPTVETDATAHEWRARARHRRQPPQLRGGSQWPPRTTG